MKLFPTFGFLSAFTKAKADQAGDSLIAFIVKFDPASASEAQIAEFEQRLNELTQRVAGLRADYRQEEQEAKAIDARYHQMLAAAESLQKQSEEPANAARKDELEKSLGTLLTEIEKIIPDVEREQKEAEDAKAFLEEFEQAAKDMAEKLGQARGQLKDAQRGMQKAALQKERAAREAEQAAVLVGIRSHGDSMGIALNAMKQVAQKDTEAAEGLKLKAQLLKGQAHKSVEQDPNIAAAMAAASGAAKPPVSLTDRLAALKGRQAVPA